MFKKVLLLSLFIFTSLEANRVNIAVAANVSYAIKDLIKAFNETNPDTKIRVTLGSSGKLTAQIINGAPYEIFMSADMDFPNTLHEKAYTLNKPIVYAQGSLAMLSSKPQDFSLNLAVLKSPTIKKIAIANPKTAPYGKAAKEALEKEHLYATIKNKLVFGESISQTVAYTVRATDIGLIATSSLYSDKMRHFKQDVHWKEIDKSLYTPIKQGVVLLKEAKENQGAQLFYHFILSQKAQEIFKNYGYLSHE